MENHAVLSVGLNLFLIAQKLKIVALNFSIFNPLIYLDSYFYYRENNLLREKGDLSDVLFSFKGSPQVGVSVGPSQLSPMPYSNNYPPSQQVRAEMDVMGGWCSIKIYKYSNPLFLKRFYLQTDTPQIIVLNNHLDPHTGRETVGLIFHPRFPP